MTGPGTFFARAEWRGRWRAHLGLAAIVAVVVAAVLATLIAATRSERAFSRLRAATHAADVSVFVDDRADLDEARRMVGAVDGVAATSAEAQVFAGPAGRKDLYPGYNLLSRAPVDASDAARMNAPVVVKGRAADPDRADEVLLSERLADRLDVSVGDELILQSATTAWVDAAEAGGFPKPLDGPSIRTTVVGLARSSADFDRWAGLIHLTPAFVTEYGGALDTMTRVQAQITDGTAPSSRLRADLSAVGEQFSSEGGAEYSAFADSDAASDGLATIARALRIVAAVAAVAGAVVIVLAVSRLARITFRDHAALRALGCTRSQFLSTSVIVFGPALLLGAAGGLALGIVLAPRALVGLAGRVDPEPHRVLMDGRAVLLVGGVALAVGVLAAAAAGRRTERTEALRTRPTPRFLRLDRPVPVVLGARRALTGEAELGGRTSRSAVLVLAVAVAGAIAALVVSASISRLQTDPLLSGQGSSTGRSIGGESLDEFSKALPVLKADRRVTALNGLHIAFGTRSGDEEVQLLIFDRFRGSLGASVIEGRVPRSTDEIALGPVTLEALGKNVGDRVRLTRGDHQASYRIVGAALFPEGDFQPSDAGAALPAVAAERLLPDVEQDSHIHSIEFEWADGVNARRADSQLEAAGFEVFTSDDPARVFPPRVTNLGEVEDVPRYLAVFLGLLALVTLGHALATSARRRSFETATLRALGLTQEASAGILVTQATTMVFVALVVGVPCGLLFGDRIWTLIAEGANVVVMTIDPVGALLAFVAAVVALAAVVTIGPAWRTARLRPGAALRAE